MPQYRRRYPWPASRLERDTMHSLHLASTATGKPITVLIEEAVSAQLNARLEIGSQPQPQPIGFAHQAPTRPAA